MFSGLCVLGTPVSRAETEELIAMPHKPIRYDTKSYFNVRSSQLNLLHGTYN